MMIAKLGCCLNMLAQGTTGIGEEWLPLFASLSYDYVEVPLAQIMALSEGEFTGLLRAVDHHGIPVEACNNFFPSSVRLTGETASLEAALAYARQALDRAARMGAQVVVLGSAGAKNVPAGYPLERAMDQLAALCCHLQEIAHAKGITITLEPLNRQESNILNTVEACQALAQRVSQPNIRLLLDFYHLRMEHEPLANLLQTEGMLRHVHIASLQGRAFPAPDDGEDYASLLSALREIGYAGRVSVEAYTGNPERDAAVAADLLRPLLRL